MKKFLCPYSKMNNQTWNARLNIYGEHEVWGGKYITCILESRYINSFRKNTSIYRIHLLQPGSMKEFKTLDLAKIFLDNQLIKLGYTLLTEEQANKYRMLL
jgi:hypothetical protein